MSASDVAPYLLLPAKFGSSEQPGFHPLICHMLDTAAVARRIWDDVLSPVARQRLASSMGLDAADAGEWVAFLAGAHDVGKASPAFLSYGAAEPLRQLLPPDLIIRPHVTPRDAPHGVITTLELARLLETRLGMGPVAATRLAAISGGHHGTLPSALTLQDARGRPGALGGPSWASARHQLLEGLAASRPLPAATPVALDNASAMWLAGLISVADWIASAAGQFPFFAGEGAVLPDGAAFVSYPALAGKQATDAIERLRWGAVRPPSQPRSFAELFPRNPEPRPLQEQARQLAEKLSGPALVIIEAPTGEGKTEAALTLTDRFRATAGTRGFYLALPTQATSNQMYRRASEFLRNSYDADATVLLQLLHGHAALSAEFERALQTTVPAQIDADEAGATVAAGEWFTYRKRGLLAPFGVGTIDQALLAVLQTRHVFVRLFGLANKTVVIDEVHAYDTYMTALIERLLEWLAALGSPVIMLSATLPRERTSALAAAYARGLGLADRPLPELAAYPRVTWLSTGEWGSLHTETSSLNQRTLGLEWIDGRLPGHGGPFALGEFLKRQLGGGGCAAVICNTVNRAQEVYRALKAYFGGTASDGEPELDLLHARFLFEDRELREQRVVRRFGPGGEHRPTRAILVATQIIEQSLDLDFDVMVSDLAPADLLLQRAGRLHRHQRARPAGDVPVLHMCTPVVREGGVPGFDRGDTAVYDEHVLLRTWLGLQGRSRIAVPSGVEQLVEYVYGAPHGLDLLSGGLRNAWQATRDRLMSQRERDTQEARERWLKPPSHEGDLARFTSDPREEDSPEFHQAHQALTRLAEPSAHVVCLLDTADGPALPDDRIVDVRHKPGIELAQALLRRSVPVATRGLVQAIYDLEVPAGWRRSPLLRNHRMLLFDGENRCIVRTWTLRLNPDTGLEIERSGG